MVLATARVVDDRSTLAPSEPLDVQVRVQVEQAVGALPRNTELTPRVLQGIDVPPEALRQYARMSSLPRAVPPV